MSDNNTREFMKHEKHRGGVIYVKSLAEQRRWEMDDFALQHWKNSEYAFNLRKFNKIVSFARHHLEMINRSTLKNRKNNQTEGCWKCEKESAALYFMSKEI